MLFEYPLLWPASNTFLLKIEAKFELKDLHFTTIYVGCLKTLLPPLSALYQKHKQSQSRATNCMATTYLELSLREPFTDTHVHCIVLELSSLLLGYISTVQRALWATSCGC